jgi:hypothetical protein
VRREGGQQRRDARSARHGAGAQERKARVRVPSPAGSSSMTWHHAGGISRRRAAMEALQHASVAAGGCRARVARRCAAAAAAAPRVAAPRQPASLPGLSCALPPRAGVRRAPRRRAPCRAAAGAGDGEGEAPDAPSSSDSEQPTSSSQAPPPPPSPPPAKAPRSSPTLLTLLLSLLQPRQARDTAERAARARPPPARAGAPLPTWRAHTNAHLFGSHHADTLSNARVASSSHPHTHATAHPPGAPNQRAADAEPPAWRGHGQERRGRGACAARVCGSVLRVCPRRALAARRHRASGRRAHPVAAARRGGRRDGRAAGRQARRSASGAERQRGDSHDNSVAGGCGSAGVVLNHSPSGRRRAVRAAAGQRRAVRRAGQARGKPRGDRHGASFSRAHARTLSPKHAFSCACPHITPPLA